MDPHGHRSRLRDRYFSAGLDAFAPHEILEFLLTFAIPRRDTKPIAYELISKFGSLHAVFQATPQELMTVNGIGEHAATLISMVMPLFKAYNKSIEKEVPVLKNLDQCLRYCQGLFSGDRFEKMYVICLDARMRRIHTALVSSGDVTEVHVYARHIVTAATSCGATGIIITHNHPSGNAEPSREDILLTDAIATMMNGIGITLFDHIVISPVNNFSFRRGGLLDITETQDEIAAQFPERLLKPHRIGRQDTGGMECEENGDLTV